MVDRQSRFGEKFGDLGDRMSDRAYIQTGEELSDPLPENDGNFQLLVD